LGQMQVTKEHERVERSVVLSALAYLLLVRGQVSKAGQCVVERVL